jgi:hypothetical protein
MEDRPGRGKFPLPAATFLAVAIVCAAALVLARADAAGAHSGHVHLGERATERAIGAGAAPAADGLYSVRVGGEKLLTHGPDPAPPSERIATRGADSILGLGGPERAPVCSGEYRQHVLVAHVAGTPDRVEEVRGNLQTHFRRMNWLLNADAVAAGGSSADYKVLCDDAGQVRVDSFASPSGGFEDIVRAARAAGFDDPRTDYTIFFDGLGPGGGCGIGSYRADERLVADNASNTGGGYGITYQPCWYGTTPMHENAHNQGAVQYSAPQSTGSGGHCNRGHDVLCYAPDGGDRNQVYGLDCSDRVHFDCGDDDYFDPAPEPGEYLESHWNLGSPLNRFIAFGNGPVQAEAPAADPGCASPACAQRVRLGATVSGEVGTAAGQVALYRVRVPGGRRSLDVQVAGPEPVALAVRRGTVPDGSEADCASARNRLRQTCRLTRPKRGTWYFAVADLAGAAAVEFDLRTSAAASRRR